jgi:hypothetical protein
MFRLALPVLLLLSSPIEAQDSRVLRAASDAEIAKAVAAAKPGDTILIADGTYAELLRVKASGKAGKPVAIKAEHPGKAVFDREGQSARIEGSFLRFEGLVFDSQYGDCTCVRVEGRGIHFLNCEIRRPGSIDGKGGGDGLQFYNSSDCLIEECHIHHCLATRNGERFDSHGIRFTHSRDMTVRGCFIDLVSGDCVQVDPNREDWDNIVIEDCRLSGGKAASGDTLAHPRFAPGSYTSENAVDTKCPKKGRPRITIRNCEAYGFRGPIGNAAALNIKESCEAVIDRCTIHDCEIGLRLRGPAQVRVTNCVLYDNDTHCRYEDRIPKLHIVHCTFGAATGKGRGAFHEQRPSPDLRVVGCLFLGERPKQADGAANQAVDASRFANVAKGDYRLIRSMPMRNAGPAANGPDLRVDRAGHPRPPDQPADAGAYQYERRE